MSPGGLWRWLDRVSVPLARTERHHTQNVLMKPFAESELTCCQMSLSQFWMCCAMHLNPSCSERWDNRKDSGSGWAGTVHLNLSFSERWEMLLGNSSMLGVNCPEKVRRVSPSFLFT